MEGMVMVDHLVGSVKIYAVDGLEICPFAPVRLLH